MSDFEKRMVQALERIAAALERLGERPGWYSSSYPNNGAGYAAMLWATRLPAEERVLRWQ